MKKTRKRNVIGVRVFECADVDEFGGIAERQALLLSRELTRGSFVVALQMRAETKNIWVGAVERKNHKAA